MRFPDLTLVDEHGAPVVGAGVVVIGQDGTGQDVNSDDVGRVDMVLTPEAPREAWIAAEGYRAAVVQPSESGDVQVSRLPGGGSLVIERTGYIPGLGSHMNEDGRLSPIYDGQDRTYIYLNNISFNGMSNGPHSFQFGQPFVLADSLGRQFQVIIKAMAGQRALVEYERDN